MTEMHIRCSHDEVVKLSELKAHPKNRNKHPDDQLKRLADILNYQGWRYPVKVSKRSGLVTSGHGRIEAAKLNGWTQAPVSFQDYDSEEQEYADVQADNAIASWAELDLSGINSDVADLGPDFDIDMLGIRDFVLEPAEMVPMADDDDVPEFVDPRTKLGDIYSLGTHRLMCGDSTAISDVDALLGGNSPGLIFSDPPYGIDYQDVKKNHKKIANDSEQAALPELLAILTSFNVPMFICCNWKCYSTFERIMNEASRPVKACIVWDKGSRVQNLDKFGKQHEFILYSGPFGGEKTLDVDVWPCKREVRKDHPTSKPVELVERALGHFPRKKVLDLFGGSGSTLIASEKLGSPSFIMELDPHYCDVIVTRWENYTGKKAVLLNGPQQD